MSFVDLTHPFTAAMPTFPGDPSPELIQNATLEKDGSIGFELKTGLHIGTHIDAPLHFIPGGKRVADFPPEKFIGRGIAVGINSPDLESIRTGDIVLIHTGWSQKFGQADYYQNFPVISEDFAQKLVAAKIKMVGFDSSSPDYPPYSVHKILLSQDILILENLTNLEALLPYPQFEIFALPLRLEAEASPVRVIARLP